MNDKRTDDIEQRMGKAIAHPLRMRLLMLLNQQVASPSELAGELDMSLGKICYHMRILADLEAIELVETAPRRGAVEHYYRAVMRPWFKKDAWERLPVSIRQSISGAVLDQVWKETVDALEAGLFDQKTNRHLSRVPLVLDDEAFEELRGKLDEVLETALRLQAESAERLNGSGEEGHAARLVLMHYLVPPEEKAVTESEAAPAKAKSKRQKALSAPPPGR